MYSVSVQHFSFVKDKLKSFHQTSENGQTKALVWPFSELSYNSNCSLNRGWSGGAMVLGNLPVPGRPTNLD